MSKPDTPIQADDQPRTVEIPAETAEAFSNRLAGTEFDSVDDYVAFVLEQLLYELEREDGSDPRPDDRGSADEPSSDESVSERLESLGYL